MTQEERTALIRETLENSEKILKKLDDLERILIGQTHTIGDINHREEQNG
jgi:hypothetical protein